MPITLDTQSSGAASATSVTVSHTVNSGSNRILIVQAFADFDTAGGVGITGATYNGTALTQIATFDTANIVAWYMVAPPVGTANIVVSQANSRGLIVQGTSLFGVNQTTPASGSTSAYSTSGVTVTSAVGSLVFAQSGDDAGRTSWAASGAQTSSGVQNTGTTYAAWGLAPGAPSVAMTWAGAGANGPRNLGFSILDLPFPAITVQPTQQSAASGSTATFSVTASGATSYQWNLAGSPISGATSSSYTTGTLTAANNGTVYSVDCTNTNGTTTSASVYLFIIGESSADGDKINSSWFFR